MLPSGMRVPIFHPTVWLIMMVCAHQLVRSSGPSTERLKSLMALIWSSQLIGGASSAAPSVAFLKERVTSGRRCRPAPDVTRPSRISYQRPVSSSRAVSWATRLRSLRRARKTGWRQAVNFSTWASPHRMSENFTMAMLMGVPLARSPAPPRWWRRRRPYRGFLLSDGSNIYPISQNLPAKTRDGFRITAASGPLSKRLFRGPLSMLEYRQSLRAFVRGQMELWGRVLNEANIRLG